MAGRCTVGAVVLACAMLVAVQYWRLIQQNVGLASQLTSAQHDVGVLSSLREQQVREIHRLRDPLGTIPEIHDRLHMVGKHEALIYVQGAGAPTQAP
ncbi:MAG TPA: hypothetical protein VGD50_04080 [Candidatus Baltobacteraceae bacterium]